MMLACQKCRHLINGQIIMINRDDNPVTQASSTQSAPIVAHAELAANYQGSAPFQRRIIHPADSLHLQSSTFDSGGAETKNVIPDEGGGDASVKVANIIDQLAADAATIHDYCPLCEECAESLCDILSRQLEDIELENRLCQERLIQNEAGDQDGDSDLEAEIGELKYDERKLMGWLEELESSICALNGELDSLRDEEKELDSIEDSYWQELNSLDLRSAICGEEYQSLDTLTRYEASHIERLKKCNVLNDAFHIWHDGPFGTINGFRLGRLPDIPVDWGEINAALGQACLLLHVLAERSRFNFHIYHLVPLGNFSRVEKHGDDKAIYELYGSGEFQISRLFWNRRFDQGLVAFLNCIQQLGEFAQQKDSSFKLPYSISKDKIGDASVKTQFNQDENWTKSLKYLLTDLKWLLAFFSEYI